tara:strand:- start:867 stop:983 length:117 start_codon:yes stop_codon:yes gene_type:complete
MLQRDVIEHMGVQGGTLRGEDAPDVCGMGKLSCQVIVI